MSVSSALHGSTEVLAFHSNISMISFGAVTVRVTHALQFSQFSDQPGRSLIQVIEFATQSANTFVDPCKALETDMESSSRTIAQTLSPNTPIAGPPPPPGLAMGVLTCK